jgi:glucose-6-phosphate isomerase
MENNSDEQKFLNEDFMADLTIINAGKVGKEFVKTVGHYHQNVPGTKIAYPEAYEAVSGNFEYLLQSEPDSEGKVDVIWVVTKPGDKVVMPPNYGHVSMNVGDEPAIEVDIQKRDNPNGSDYTMFKERIGGALYRTEDGLCENPNYKIASLKIARPKEKPDWGLTKDKPLYTSFVENPEKFHWLLEPQNYDFKLDELFEDVEL